jgi:hypothetical protein
MQATDWQQRSVRVPGGTVKTKLGFSLTPSAVQTQ